MRKLKLLIPILILSLIITGCPQMRQLDTLGIINTRGIDINEQDQIKGNFVMFQFDEQATDLQQIVSGTGATSMGAIRDANFESNLRLESGLIQLDLYGLKTAKKGIAPYVDPLNRDPNTPNTMYLALSKTTAEEIITAQGIESTSNIGKYLHDIIDENGKGSNYFPKVTLNRFMLFYKDSGRDPILPMFEISDGKPKISSIGVLKGDKYVGQLPINNSVLFNLQSESITREFLEISIPSEPFKNELSDQTSKSTSKVDITMSILDSKSRVKLNNNSLQFNHSISLEGNLNEISFHDQLNLEDPKILKKIETGMEKEMKRRYEELLEELQSLNSDPLGYGEIYRQNLRHERLTEDKWRSLYPDIKVNYNIDVELIYHGETF